MQVNPYLSFNGNCREAFQFYEKVFGGKIETMQTFGDSPMKDQAPPNWGDKIMHAAMKVGSQALMGSDAPDERYHKPGGIYISIQIEDPADADRIFNSLSQGASVEMPIQQTYWAKRFGMLTDRYGIPWMINC